MATETIETEENREPRPFYPDNEVERATQNYLTVSRNAATFIDTATYEREEEKAWEKLQGALDRAAKV